MVRANLPAAMQGLVVVPLFAGYDERRATGRVFSFDVAGGKYEETDFQTNGSGGVHARNWIKAQWTDQLSRDDVIQPVVSSRVKSRRGNPGVRPLIHAEVRTCPYRDV